MPTTTTIASLPELPLLRVFDHLPYYDLIHRVRLVCVHWSGLYRHSLATRTTLTLVGCSMYDGQFGTEFQLDGHFTNPSSNRGFQGQQERVHLLHRLEQREMRQVLRHFPRVTALSVHHLKQCSLASLAALVHLATDHENDCQWSETVTRLRVSLGGAFDAHVKGDNGWDSYRNSIPVQVSVDVATVLYHTRMMDLFTALATRFTRLRELSVWYGGELSGVFPRAALESFVSRGIRLEWISADASIDSVVSVLLEATAAAAADKDQKGFRFATNTPLTRVSTLERVAERPSVAGTITRLALSRSLLSDLVDVECRIINGVMDHFTALSELWVGALLPPMSLVRLFRVIRPLRALRKLVLHLTITQCLMEGVQRAEDVAVLDQVTTLWLAVTVDTARAHYRIERYGSWTPLLVWPFPSLTELRVHSISCVQCQFDQLPSITAAERPMCLARCAIQATAPLGRVARCEYHLVHWMSAHLKHLQQEVRVYAASRYTFNSVCGSCAGFYTDWSPTQWKDAPTEPSFVRIVGNATVPPPVPSWCLCLQCHLGTEALGTLHTTQGS